MDFGKLPDSQLPTIDFRLPPDNAFNANVLTPRLGLPKVFVGCPVWSNKNWLGKIYPHQTKDKDMLGLYTKQFNTIELNVTHYQIPTPETITRWREASTDGFMFCPKFPQVISHDKLLQGTDALTETFCQQIMGLGSHLGLSFLQLSPYFGPKQLPILLEYLESLPENLSLAVEFRQQDWFSNKTIWSKTLGRLQDLNTATVITDVAGRRDVLHQSLPTSTVAIRWVGNEHPTDYQRIDQWIDRLQTWFDAGLKRLYLFVHALDNDTAPELATYWIRQLNQRCGLQIAEPRFLPKVTQTSLF